MADLTFTLAGAGLLMWAVALGYTVAARREEEEGHWYIRGFALPYIGFRTVQVTPRFKVETFLVAWLGYWYTPWTRGTITTEEDE